MKKFLQKYFLLVFIGVFLFASIAKSATVLFPSGGGTGISSSPSLGQILVGNSGGTYTLSATSTLGLGFSTTSAIYFVNSSSTIPKTYTANTFTQTQTATIFVANGNFIGAINANAGTFAGNEFNASTPTYGFNSDSNTGFGSSAADTAYIATNGLARLTVGSTGNVAIPTYLNVGSTTGATQLPNFISDFVCNQASYCTLNEANNSSDPAASIDFTLNNNVSTSTGTVYTDFGMNSSNAVANSGTYAGFSRPSQTYLYNTEDALSLYVSSSTNSNAYISFGTGGSLLANERMRITSAGLIGLGTTSPSQILSIAGSIFASSTGATSTFIGTGINLISAAGTSPCYAVSGNCVTGTIKTIIDRPYTATGAIVSGSLHSTTTFAVGLFTVPQTITVNQMTYNVSVISTGGTYRICVYNEASTTKLIDVTNVIINAANSVAVSPGVTLTPGNYYVAMGCPLNCGTTVSVSTWTTNALSILNGANVPTGKNVTEGTVTMNSDGSCPSTLPPISGGNTVTPVIRFDN